MKRLETIEQKRERLVKEHLRKAHKEYLINRIERFNNDVAANNSCIHPFGFNNLSVGF